MNRGHPEADTPVVVLDGPIGTELHRRGVPTPLPRWSADAAISAPDALRAIHRDYARAGATVHTANTFRTGKRAVGASSRELTCRAVGLAREAVPSDHRIAGSIAPLEDCYRPDLSPEDSYREHHEFAAVLAEAGCDLLLCETMSHPREAQAAARAALSTGLETWLALSPGPDGSLMSPAEFEEAAERAVALGVARVLVNCVSLAALPPYLAVLSASGLDFGVYANAGTPDDQIGWRSDRHEAGARRYAEAAREWVRAGAMVIGGCCGTGPEHIEALASMLRGVGQKRTAR